MYKFLLMGVPLAFLVGGVQAQPFDNWVGVYNPEAGSQEFCLQSSAGTSANGPTNCDVAAPLNAAEPMPVAASEPSPVAAPAADLNPVSLPEPAVAVQVAQASPVDPPKPPVALTAEPVELGLTAVAFFATYQAELSADSKAQLDDLLDKLDGLNWRVIKVVGYTDALGSDAVNRKLSVRRAEAVKDYFLSKGLKQDQILMAGKGASMPMADNTTPEGRARNRRVEVLVMGAPQNGRGN